MKLIPILFIFIALLMNVDNTYAQKKSKKSKKGKKEATSSSSSGKLSKSEEKKWKAKLKNMHPMDLKNLSDKATESQKEISALKQQLDAANKKAARASNVSKELALKDSRIETLKTEIEKLKKNKPSADTGGDGIPVGSEEFTKGIVYKVQVGAFRSIDLQEFVGNGTFNWEVDEDGTKKYTIGYFREYEKADFFKGYLRKMGVKDAWVVAYQDNRRQDIDTVRGTNGEEGEEAVAEVDAEDVSEEAVAEEESSEGEDW